MDNLLTAKDVAKHLRMHIITVYRLAEQGKIPGVKVGRQWRFHQDVIDEWARGRQWLDRRALLLAPGPLDGDATADVLREAGCDLAVVQDVGELAELLSRKRNRFNALLLHSAVGRRTVLAAARHVRSNAPTVPIVIIAARQFAELLDEVLEITHATVVRAPLTPRQAEHLFETLP